jgi:hypothetical protein
LYVEMTYQFLPTCSPMARTPSPSFNMATTTRRSCSLRAAYFALLYPVN